MNSLWQSLSQLFSPQPSIALPQDNTVYCIETIQAKYFGRIIYQDDVTIRLRCSKSKPVKILKENIQKISTVKNETVTQYQQWLGSKPISYSM
jgi:hypothetical protein